MRCGHSRRIPRMPDQLEIAEADPNSGESPRSNHRHLRLNSELFRDELSLPRESGSNAESWRDDLDLFRCIHPCEKAQRLSSQSFGALTPQLKEFVNCR